MPLRILYVASTLSRSGPTMQLLGLVAHLDRTRYAPQVLTLSPEPEDTLRPAFEALGVPVRSLGLTRLAMMLHGRRALLRAVRACAPDILHTHGIRADGALARGIGRPLRAHLATVHNDAYADYPAAYGAVTGRIMAARHTAALKRIPHPVAVSDSIGRVLATRGIHAEVVCNGIDAGAFAPPSPQERADLRAELGIADDVRVFVYAGVFIARKNVVQLAQVFLQAGLGARAVLVMLGAGPLLDEVRELVAQSGMKDSSGAGTVRTPGAVSDVARWYRCADVFVSASRAEGLPMAVIEAMACGLPVLLSDIDAHREVAARAGDACTLCALDDLSALAGSFVRLCDAPDPGVRRAAARAAVESFFTAEVMSAGYQAIYRRIAGT